MDLELADTSYLDYFLGWRGVVEVTAIVLSSVKATPKILIRTEYRPPRDSHALSDYGFVVVVTGFYLLFSACFDLFNHSF